MGVADYITQHPLAVVATLVVVYTLFLVWLYATHNITPKKSRYASAPAAAGAPTSCRREGWDEQASSEAAGLVQLGAHAHPAEHGPE